MLDCDALHLSGAECDSKYIVLNGKRLILRFFSTSTDPAEPAPGEAPEHGEYQLPPPPWSQIEDLLVSSGAPREEFLLTL